jgi:hypothetical protein
MLPRFAAALALRGAGAAFLLPGVLGGCAYSYVAPDGSRHVIGLLHAVLPAEPAGRRPAESLRTHTFGLSFTQADVGTALALGYSDITFAFVRENTCVQWPLVRLPSRSSP